MFTFLKELWQMVKMLFSSKPNDSNELKLLAMQCFPFQGYKYMMWCGKMIYRKKNEERILSEINTPSFLKNKTHETTHLKQAQVKGRNSWLRYYLIYVWEWIKGNPITNPANSAYYTIPFEMEAYANEEDPNYPLNYDGKYLHCYNIKNRKKTYRKYGNSRAWKEYIKTIEKTIK